MRGYGQIFTENQMLSLTRCPQLIKNLFTRGDTEHALHLNIFKFALAQSYFLGIPLYLILLAAIAFISLLFIFVFLDVGIRANGYLMVLFSELLKKSFRESK